MRRGSARALGGRSQPRVSASRAKAVEPRCGRLSAIQGVAMAMSHLTLPGGSYGKDLRVPGRRRGMRLESSW